MTKPNFEISADTRLLYQVLARVQPGQTVSYARLSEAVGYAVSGSTTHLQSALRMATTNDEAVFDNIRGEGYRRLTDEEIISAATRDTDSLRRKARRAARKLATVSDFSAMPPEKRIEHNARLSLFGAITAMTKPKAIDQLRESVRAAGNELPLHKTLAAFQKRAESAA